MVHPSVKIDHSKLSALVRFTILCSYRISLGNKGLKELWHDFVPNVEAPALAGTALGITVFLTAFFLFTWEKGATMVKNDIIISIV